MRPFLPIAAAAAVLAFGIAGCGSSSGNEDTPSACLVGAQAYENALKTAPQSVSLAEQTPISDCLTSGQSGGELSNVGTAMVGAATALNAQARKDPDSPAATELGYLIGAADAGADTTGGIHADLIRRLNSAARYGPNGALPASFRRAFARGYAAGRESG